MSDWWATVRIFPPSPLEPGIPFLNHLSLYSILHLSTCNPSEGIPVPPQLVEKVVYVDMKALEEEAAVNCCGRHPLRPGPCAEGAKRDTGVNQP